MDGLNELSLFTGGGGGVLASLLLGWRTIGYLEHDRYCCDRLIDRMREGHLCSAPVWCGDIREFVASGCAAEYRGLVDVVTAGFPCQPFSVAGKQRGADDERNMWPATARVLDVVRPEWALLENVPALLTSGYFGTILGDLAEIGFDAEWGVFSAAGSRAPHLRKRLWIVGRNSETSRNGNDAHANGGRQSQLSQRNSESKAEQQAQQRNDTLGFREDVSNASGEGLSPSEQEELRGSRGREEGGAITQCGWWAAEPDVGRVAHGVAARVDRLRCLGNGQVPAVAAMAWRILAENDQVVAPPPQDPDSE